LTLGWAVSNPELARPLVGKLGRGVPVQRACGNTLK